MTSADMHEDHKKKTEDRMQRVDDARVRSEKCIEMASAAHREALDQLLRNSQPIVALIMARIAQDA